MRRSSLWVFVVTSFAATSCERSRDPAQVVKLANDSSRLASDRTDSSRLATEVASQPKASAPADTDSTKPLTCTPSTFAAGDTLTLLMRTPHGNYLIATQPGDSLFYIIYPQLNVPTRKYSLIPSDAFTTTRTLRVPANLRAVAWYYGRDTMLVPLFTRPGKYTLTMGEKLEGDYSARSVSCSVKFAGQK